MTAPRLTVPLGCALALLLAVTAAVAAPPRALAAAIDLRTHPAFEIVGPATNANAGEAVSTAGDVNGDGLADVAVAARVGITTPLGAPAPDLASLVSRQGAVFVVFGKRDGAPVDLAHLQPSQGLEILGADPAGGTSSFGAAVAGGRDVDGDGRPDLVVADEPLRRLGVAPDPATQKAYTYVISGAALHGGDVLRADHLGAAGYRLRGAGGGASLVGDMNGDGRAEIALNGAATVRGRAGAGSVWVVRGRGAGSARIAALGAAALRIDGAYAHDGLGSIASAGGDFDGDGRPDLIIGGDGATRDARTGAGLAWIVSGARP